MFIFMPIHKCSFHPLPEKHPFAVNGKFKIMTAQGAKNGYHVYHSNRKQRRMNVDIKEWDTSNYMAFARKIMEVFELWVGKTYECWKLNRLCCGCLEDNSVEKLQVMEVWLVKFQRGAKSVSGLFIWYFGFKNLWKGNICSTETSDAGYWKLKNHLLLLRDHHH